MSEAASKAAVAPDARQNAAALAALDATPLFTRLPPERRRSLAAIATLQQVAAGQRIVAEGTSHRTLFVVVEGEVEIARLSDSGAPRHHLRHLARGETFGELALLSETPASASVYAATPATLLALPVGELQRCLGEDTGFQPLYHTLAEQLDARLRSLTDVTVRALEREIASLRARLTIGQLFIATVVVMSLYAYALGVGAKLTHGDWPHAIMFAASVLGVGTVVVLARSGSLPLAFWGFTLRGWRPAVRDALVASAAFLALLVGVKWILIHWTGGSRDLPLVFLQLPPLQDVVYVAITVPLQELVIRGCVQGTLSEFLTGRHRTLWAIFTSNLIFSVMHSQFSIEFALLTLLPGFLWGWLYARQRTLIGPILSHAIIGVFALDMMGLLDLLH